MKWDRLSWIKNKNTLAFFGMILLFLIIKISEICFRFSDGNIYFYMGKLILQGQLPYQNFFFASPPMQILVIAGFLSLFGAKVILLKIIPILACIISSTLIFTIIKKKFNSLWALISATLYLFSFVVLTTTDYSTGIHLTTLFIVLSCYLIYKEKYFLGGIIASLSLLTRLYAAFAVLGIMIFLLIKNRKAFLNFILGIIIIFIPVNLLLILLFKGNYLNSVFLYHLLKSEGIPKLTILKFFLKWDFILISLSALALIFKDKKKILLPLIIAGTILLFYIFYADIYYLYFGLLMPFLAILGGYSLYKLTKKVPQKFLFILIIFLLGIIIINNSAFYIKNHSSTAKIDFIYDIVKYVQENSRPQDKIYGDFEIAPLVALMSKREITNNYVDTNEKTFISGLYNIKERTNAIRGNTKFVLIKALLDQKGKILHMNGIIEPDFLLKECNLTKTYPIKADYSDNAVLVFDCGN